MLLLVPNGKIKKEPKNVEIDINVGKKQAILCFSTKQQISRQMANSAVQRENSCAAEYCWPWS